jgi:hypothetical protein
MIAMLTAKKCTACKDGQAFPLAFAMAFQPIIDASAGTMFAYEALVRGPEGQGAMSVLGSVDDSTRYAFDQALTCPARAPCSRSTSCRTQCTSRGPASRRPWPRPSARAFQPAS